MPEGSNKARYDVRVQVRGSFDTQKEADALVAKVTGTTDEDKSFVSEAVTSRTTRRDRECY
jgi:hypothetical protein